jgi:hypothetical protein
MRNFNGISLSKYIGALYRKPVKTNDTKFGGQPPLPPYVVPALFQWISYGAGTANTNISVPITLPVAGPSQLLDKIRSVRIDNLGNPVPVYVYFPDTQYTVVAPPNSIVWEPVDTGQFDALVIAEGFTDALLTNSPNSTAVYFCNFGCAPLLMNEFPQTSPLWLASNTITRGTSIYNQNYGTPSLADQFTNEVLSLAVSGNITGVLPNQASGFYYINAYTAIVSNISGFNFSVRAVFESPGASGILFDWSWQVPPAAFSGSQLPVIVPFPSLNGLNLKIDATQSWRLRTITGNVNAGLFQFNVAYTFNPQ